MDKIVPVPVEATIPSPLFPRTTPAVLEHSSREVGSTRIFAAEDKKPQRGWFLIELAASVTTLSGMYVGSTTTHGALLYLVSLLFWYALTVHRRLWGLMPLNVATTFVALVNLWHATHPAAAAMRAAAGG